MSDEAALLNAIELHPDEDTPRLMYADWLEEHGQHVRAEFIRVQIEVAHVEELPRIELNKHVGIFRRNQDLLDNHRAELLGASLPTTADAEFRRGFAWDVTLSVFHFHQVAQTLAAMRPLPRVTVRDSVGVIREFLGFGVYLDADRTVPLVTTVTTTPDDAEDVGPLAVGGMLKTWPRLDTLDVSGCHVGDESVGILFWSSFPKLTDLDLSGNDLSDAAVEALLARNLPRQLRRLILGGNDVTDAGALALANRWPTGPDDRLENLNLRFTRVGQAGQAALLRRFGGRVDLF